MLPQVLALLLLANGDPVSRTDWTTSDTALQLSFTAIMAVDFLQTATDIAPNCREMNPILGKCPTTERIVVYGASMAVAHFMVSLALPKPYRTIWQSVWIGVETATISRNHVVGARIKF